MISTAFFIVGGISSLIAVIAGLISPPAGVKRQWSAVSLYAGIGLALIIAGLLLP